MAWNFKAFGTASDPLHKSSLAAITGDYGCDAQYRRRRDAEADGLDLERDQVSGRAAVGNATHETIARALDSREARTKLLAGAWRVTADQVGLVMREEMERERAGRTIAWYDDDERKVVADRVSMIVGLLNDLHRHVAEIVLVEAGFVVRLGDYWMSGHTDLLYRPRAAPDEIAVADWKTGAQKPDEIELDHGWEGGIYSAAVRSGLFLGRDALTDTELRGATTARQHRAAMERALIERALGADASGVPIAPTFGRFPAQIWHVHLADYVPYQKAGSKEIKRPEDCRHFGVEPGTKVKYVAGDVRGPAWLPVRRTESDIPRLEHQLRNVVGSVRMGRFIERVGEKCRRCAFRLPCLTGGYDARGDELVQLRGLARAIGGNAEDGLAGL